MRRLHPCILAALLVVSASAVEAQPLPAIQAGPAPELDLRLGALWPESGAEARPAMGLRLALRPWTTTLSGRLSLQFTGDFRSFGGQDGYDDAFQVRRRLTRNRMIVGAAVGVDVVRTARTTVDIRIGGAMVRSRTNFLIDSSQGFVDDLNQWENVCAFQGFKERCRSDYDATGLVSVGLRRDLVRSGAAFVGLDVTGLGIDQRLLMGTIGMRLR